MYITNDASIGVYPFVIESPALITIWANCGDILDCINIGTIIGEKIIHLLAAEVNKKLDNAINTNDIKINGRSGKRSILYVRRRFLPLNAQ